MIQKIVNPETKQVTLVYPAYLKRKPITHDISSSLHAQNLHQRYTQRYILDEIKAFVNQRFKAIDKHHQWTPERKRAINALRELLQHHQDGKLLTLCIAVTRAIPHMSVLAPSFRSRFRAHYDKSIQKIADYCSEYATRRAPYRITIH